MTGDAALAQLKAGNQRFAQTTHQARLQPATQRANIDFRPPFASVLTCSDSRVAPEIIFSMGLGDIYVVRGAGNVVTMTERASMEFAATVFNCPLIVTVGHSQCRAVQSAIELSEGKTFPGDIQELASLIAPAVAQTKHDTGDRWENAILENVRLSVQRLLQSDVLHELVTAGTLKIVGAYYSVESGTVRFL